ncbi:MAG: GNAT family N-acetyltransferase [Brooklawnia sp.]|nr:GNAT family N-acetyltransferase [Brooklawnia sp.]
MIEVSDASWRRRLPDSVQFPTAHRWPVSLRAGAVVLRPISRHEELIWEGLRAANYQWTHEWDATEPPEVKARPLPFPSWLKWTEKQARAGRALPFGLAHDPDWPSEPRPIRHTRLIGQLSVAGIVEGSARSAAIGYWIDRQYAGRGIVPTAVALACDYCWQVMRLHRIEISIRPENGRSLRVVEKLGFREEGLRPRFLHINGDWRDHRVFALNAEEVPNGLLNRYLASRG